MLKYFYFLIFVSSLNAQLNTDTTKKSLLGLLQQIFIDVPSSEVLDSIKSVETYPVFFDNLRISGIQKEKATWFLIVKNQHDEATKIPIFAYDGNFPKLTEVNLSEGKKAYIRGNCLLIVECEKSETQKLRSVNISSVYLKNHN